MSLRIESKEALEGDRYYHERTKCLKRLKRKRVEKYVGFDTSSTCEGGGRTLIKTICDDRWSPCRGLVRLYARMGLHRYNLLEGKNLQFCHVKKYNMTNHSAASSYYITLRAMDPARNERLTFQTLVSEKRYGHLILTSNIARPRGTNTEDGPLITECPKLSLPECPPEDLFENRKQFYVINESELQHNDWIRLYLELAVATSHRHTDHDLSNLKIVKVAIETTEQDPNEGSLNAINALVYIRYKDFCESRVGKDVDRIAIVRRTFKESKGGFILEGHNQVIKS
ncbi:hypothetical protein V5N11_025655 [Cardamine amara subsp. amara]|uniref:Uncharacterized protein n=1 Tax=Cardamine amara subsp. amara TaxID=228776 RepID=A0ABD0ZU34_CARAN